MMEELGLTYTQVGTITSGLFLAYAIGQFINGQLGDLLGARKLITMGIVGSAVLNFIYGGMYVFVGLVIIWAANGYFQSCGWAPSCRLLTNWFPRKYRGRMTGIYGMSYQIGTVCSWLLTGWVVASLGWRWAFRVNPLLYLLWGIVFVVMIRNSPEDVGLPPIEREESTPVTAVTGVKYTLRHVLSDWRIWACGMALFFCDITRYGLSMFAPAFFAAKGIPIAKVAMKIAVLPMFGAAGAATTGWASDRFFGGKRTLLIAALSFILAGAVIGIYLVPVGVVIPFIMMAVAGFCMYGVQLITVGTLPMDLAGREATASAAGFVDFLGYIGAFSQGIISGILIDRLQGGFTYAFYFWAGAAVVQGLILLVVYIKARV